MKCAPPLVMKQFDKGVEKILNHRTWEPVERIGGPITLFSGKIVWNQRLHGSGM